MRTELVGKFGPKARRWKGDEAGYVAKHMWINKHYGKARSCSFNKNHKSTRYHWANISGKYKREVTDYIPLCPSCHKIFDRKQTCKNGHLYTPQNTYIRKQGWRMCRICMYAAQRKFHNAKNNQI